MTLTSDFVELYFQGKYNNTLILNSIEIPLFSQVFLILRQ